MLRRLWNALALLRGVFRSRRTRRRLDEEIRFHIDQQAERNEAAGMAPAEARRAALVAFGGTARATEEATDEVRSRALAELAQDLRYAARTLRRSPAFATLASLTLAVGIGATTVFFSAADHVVLRPLPYPDASRLVVLREVIEELRAAYPSVGANASHFLEWQRRCTACAGLAAIRSTTLTLVGRGDPERLGAVRVSPELFPLLGARAALGRLLTEADDRPGSPLVVVLSDGLWRRLGADPSLVGQTLLLDDPRALEGGGASAGGEVTTEALVVGVLDREFRFARGTELGTRLPERADAFVPLALTERERTTFGEYDYAVIARLAPGATAAGMQQELEAIAGDISRGAAIGITLHSLVLPMQELIVGSTGLALLLLLAAVGAVLLIICVNLANLMLARNLGRAREWGVRMAMGARRGRLVRHALTESVILALVGGAAGVLLARWGLGALLALAPTDLPRLSEIRLDGRVLAVSLTLSLLAGLGFGALPAIRSSRAEPSAVLAGGDLRTTADRRAIRARGLLIAGQVGISALLLVVAALFLSSFVRVLRVDRGFTVERVLALDVSLPPAAYAAPGRRAALYDEALRRLAARPEVQRAAVTTSLPLEGDTQVDVLSLERDPKPDLERPFANIRYVSPDYFAAVGTALLRGRAFAESDRGRSVVILSQRAAEALWPGENPLGKYVVPGSNDPLAEVIGVAVDDRTSGLETAGSLVAYLPYWQKPPVVATLLVRTTLEPGGLAASLRATLREIAPTVPVNRVRTMAQVLSSAVAARRFQLGVLLVFALTALATATIGIYGIISHSMAQRGREIGIRMALGADRGDVYRLALKEGLAPAAVGIGIGLAAAVALGRVFTGLLFDVRPSDPSILAAVTAVLGLAALLACLVPARRATSATPTTALRAD